MSSLFVIQGRDQGKRFELSAPILEIGRGNTNSIQLNDTEISRHHAEIHQEGDDFALVDLESSNGSFVNGERINHHTLHNGDRLQIGRTLMIFTRQEERSSIDLADGIDIVGLNTETESRIIKSISQEEGSRVLGAFETADSPWLARARSNLQVMYRTALAVSHTLDIDQLLHRIMELIFEWVEADRGCIMLVDPETDELAPAVLQNRKGAREQEKIVISRTILDYVMEHKEGVLTSDAKEDTRWDSGESIVKMGVREAICVPMQGRYGVVGVIYIDTFTSPGRFLQNRNVNQFSEEHLKLMIAIGHQAALAVEDTSYYCAMVQAERLAAIGQTIATLSHHIKNILQGIRGGSYLIDEGLNDEDADVVRKGWKIVERNQEKISNLVMDMLSFSKERDPILSVGDLNYVVTDVIELIHARAVDAGVKLVWHPSDSMPQITFDGDAMHRAILNIVSNAIDACEKMEGRSVTVSTAFLPDRAIAQIIVEDDGEGIHQEDLKKIFSVFESRKGSRGTGLGLPVSQKILREHGGDIRVESSPGAGSRFLLELPASNQDDPSQTISLDTPP